MREIFYPNQTPAELNLGGTSTSEKVFASTDSTPVAVAIWIPNGLVSPVSTTGRQCVSVVVRCGGRVTGGTSTNFTPKFLFGVTTSAGTSIGTGAAVAVNSVSGVWGMEAYLFITTSGIIDGTFSNITLGSTRTATARLIATNAISTYDPTLLTSRQGFTVSGTFSSGNAGNKAYLDYFNMEAAL